MKRTTSWIRDYFGFSQQETKGFIVLIAILAVLISIPSFLQVSSNYTPEQYAKDQLLLDSMQVLLAQQDIKPRESRKKRNWQQPKKELFRFNPNLASQQDFERLGLASYLAKRIVKYRSKGGQFRRKQDLLNIYSFPKKLYEEWEPYISIPNKIKDTKKLIIEENSTDTTQIADSQSSKKEYSTYQNPSKTAFFKRKKPVPFDLTTADTAQLKQIRGIGSKLSKRIISFRNKLGGFHSFHQLNEVYGLQPEVIEELKKYASLQKTSLNKIDINTIDVKSLAKHPYISYKLANVIVNYREQHGHYIAINDLKKIKLVKQDFLDKIAPYLNF